MTDSELTAYIKSLIAGEDDPLWTTDTIELYKKVGMSLVSANLWHLLYPIKKTYVDVDITANEPFISLPAGCQKVVNLEIAETGQPLKYITENQLWRYERQATGEPEAWTFNANKIQLIPTPNLTKTGMYRLWYLPRPATIADLPDEVHPLVAVEAVLSAKIRDEDLTADLIMLQKRFTDIAINALSVAQVQEPESMADHESQGFEDW